MKPTQQQLDEALALVRELTERVRELQNPWQPIETAPKNCESIQGWNIDGLVPEMWHSNRKHHWRCHGTCSSPMALIGRHAPTHWQPLPKGPQQ